MAALSTSALRMLSFRALVLGPLREYPGRTLLAIAAIGLGVALGVAVHLVNASALNEFEAAARQLAGEADLVVRGPRAGFDETLYPRLARLPQVEAANPALELDVPLADRTESLRVLGFDALRAAEVQPALLPERRSLVSELFDADAILLSAAAAEWLGLGEGDTLRVRVGTRTIALRVVGLLPPGAYRQRLGVMDVASAQWRFERLGRLNRVDLRLRPGTDRERFLRELAMLLPPGVHAVKPETEAERGATLTRAYRLNLDMLALVALFTGAFLVFSSQVLALLRRRVTCAVLRAMGMTRGTLAAWLIAEGALIGTAGAALGVAAGYALAHYALAMVGADLGAGYFRAIAAGLQTEPLTLAFYFALGVAFAVLGAAAPAREAAHRAPARALRAGDEEAELEPRAMPWWGAGAIASGAALSTAPAVNGIPIAGYLAVALVLLGAVLVLPRLARLCLAQLALPARAPAAVAIAQLKATPRQAAISAAAIVISVSLMVSMLIMVHSFRTSLENWLERMLPADLYLRAARGETGFLVPEEQERLAATPGIERVEFVRVQNLLLDPARPPVTLLARPIPPDGGLLPLTARVRAPRAGEPPAVWVSEVASELYGLRPGEQLPLAVGGELRPFTVAGVWRDYARQNGTLVLDRTLYIALTGDRLADEAALWLAKSVSVTEALRALRAQLPEGASVEISTPREMRALSLAIFDRTFAITYALAAAAIAVGLFGVSVSFGASALARRREFGVLRHIGMARREIAAMLACEGALVSAFGTALGLTTGWGVGLILVHVINRQSFHWSMELAIPWPSLAGLAAAIVVAAAATAVWSGRAAMGGDAVRAVREDW
jgi:putative ABC transport system permease protein